MLPYGHKEISFRFCGQEIRLDLSRGLFSSHGLDAGTRRLLKTLSPLVKQGGINSVLDCGCGTGALGLALGKVLQPLVLDLTDRDSLAVYYSRANARKNKVHCQVREALLLDDQDNKRYDLIVSNIPAKAGNAVIEDFIDRTGGYLSENGTAAVVIVQTLSDMLKDFILEAGYTITAEEHCSQYSVYHFSGSKNYSKPVLTPYYRGQKDFLLKKVSIPLQTVWSLENFDTAGFHLHLAADILQKTSPSGKWLFWNPGQGHLPLYMQNKAGNGPEQIYLSGRDLLAIRTSAMNSKKGNPQQLPAPFFEALDGIIEENSLDGIIAHVETISGTDWYTPMAQTASNLLKKNGRFFAVGKSSDMIHLFKTRKPLRLLEDKKLKGRRGLLWEKK